MGRVVLGNLWLCLNDAVSRSLRRHVTIFTSINSETASFCNNKKLHG